MGKAEGGPRATYVPSKKLGGYSTVLGGRRRLGSYGVWEVNTVVTYPV